MSQRAMTSDDVRDLRQEMAEVRRTAFDTKQTLAAHIAGCEEKHAAILDGQKRMESSLNRLLLAVVVLGAVGIAGPRAEQLLGWLHILH